MVILDTTSGELEHIQKTLKLLSEYVDDGLAEGLLKMKELISNPVELTDEELNVIAECLDSEMMATDGRKRYEERRADVESIREKLGV